MARKKSGKLQSRKTYHVVPANGKWGDAEDIEHWITLMHGWAEQVTRDIRRLKACPQLEAELLANQGWSTARLKRAEKVVNPDAPPEPPWRIH